VRDIVQIEVRSYRSVFDLERRVYRVDTVRLNPSGVPVRGIVYAVVLALVVGALTAVPVVGLPLREFPWPVRHVLLPTALAAALSALRIDGRPCHVALRSLAGLMIGPRRVSCWRRAPALPQVWRPPDVLLIPDGSDSRLRRSRFRGPGAVVLAVGHQLHQRRGRRVTVRPAQRAHPDRKVVVLAQSATLHIRPGRN
jgi:hypothetical protein